MSEIHWTEESLTKLTDIRDYITEIDDAPRIAEQVVSRIVRRVDQLQVAPRSGRQVPDYRDQSIRELLENPYRIIYQLVDEQRIDILSVMHYRQLLPSKRKLLKASDSSSSRTR